MLLRLAIFLPFVLAGDPNKCTYFSFIFDGKYEYPNLLDAKNSQGERHHLFGRIIFTMQDNTIYAKLLDDEKLGDQQYLVRLSVTQKDPKNQQKPEMKQCRGFIRDGREECSITFHYEIVEYKFELCLSQEKCEMFFRAIVEGWDVFYPPVKFNNGGKWEPDKCSTKIDFGNNWQPPQLQYCTCCNPSTSIHTNPVCPSPDPPWLYTTESSTQLTTKYESNTSWTQTSTLAPMSELTNCTDASGVRAQFCDTEPLNNSTVGDFIANTTEVLDPKTATYKDVFWLSHILLKISTVEGMNKNDSKQLYQLYDKTLDIQEEHFYKINNEIDSSTSNRILKSIDQFLTNVELDLDLLDAKNLAMLKFQDSTDCSKDIGLSDSGKSFGRNIEDSSALASISVPQDVACKNGKTVPLYLVAYRKTQFFIPIHKKPQQKLNRLTAFLQQESSGQNPSNEDDEYHEMASDRCNAALYAEHHPVLSATVIGNKVGSDNKVKARLRFSTKNTRNVLHGKHVVSWWSLELNEWSANDQCVTKEVEGYYMADCFHLTDFSLLVDELPSDPVLCNKSLVILGYILVVGSAVCLFIMMIIQFLNLSKSARLHATKFFRTFPSMRFRVELISFIYTTMLFLFYTFFGIFGDQARASGQKTCSVFAALSYFLLLCCILLTIFQAWRILKLFAWSSKMENALAFITRNVVIIIATLIIPLAISLVGFLVEPNLFNRRDNFCWVNASDIAWAVITPLSILFANGLICLVIIVVRLFPRAACLKPVFGKLVRTNTNMISQGQRTRIRDKLLAILNMQFLLGLPWCLQYLSLFSNRATMWHYLFTIVNGSQGIVLFVLFVYRRFRARQNNLATMTSSSQNNQETQQKTLTESRKTEDSVKLRHPPVKQIMSLPTPRNTGLYENNDYDHAPQIPTHNRLNLPRRPENSRFSRSPQPQNLPNNLQKNMYIY